MSEEKIGVLFATFECVPFLKTGGLGDVAGSLPSYLNKNGCDTRVILPKLSYISEEYRNKMKFICDYYVNLGWRNVYCGLYTLKYKGVIYYFLDNEYYFKRDNIYGYFDDGERMAYFSKAVVETIMHIPDFKVDILHCNDWHTALAPVFLREFYMLSDVYKNIKTVYTVHNLKFQGQMSDYMLGDVLGLYGNEAAMNQLRCDDRSINFMKGALCYSDALSTVSNTYAEEIQTAFFGEHLEDVFRRRRDILYGILNGIDVKEYNPGKDTLIPANYTMTKMEGKSECKKSLQKELGLQVKADIPVFIMIGRLTEQKGMDLLDCIMDELMDLPLQLVVLGTGDKKYEDMLLYYQEKYKGKLSANIRFDNALSHRMYAGADALLMPSLFEPCGLSQIIAMRYGTLPVVRETGGLKDSVKSYNKYDGSGTGFSFANYNAHELLFLIKDVLGVYYDNKKAWNKLRHQAMKEDFSWTKSAVNYVNMYKDLLGE
ncbi:MAG: glycogen synthase GlgA [Lachnospiraceae bacterium]|nr:glycogen synthase GlgA [Lachnospiraceae bacterium]